MRSILIFMRFESGYDELASYKVVNFDLLSDGPIINGDPLIMPTRREHEDNIFQQEDEILQF